jgi:glycosyltransferase involved in cell wall biosynthesis
MEIEAPKRIPRNPIGPLISVLLATYEGDAEYLPRAAASLLTQDIDDEDFEVFVCVDGPPTEKIDYYIDEAFAQAPFPVTVVGLEEPTGYYTIPRNMAIPASRGLYIVHMDADNEFRPGHLSTLLKGVREVDPKRGFYHFAYTRREYVLDEGVNGELPEGESPHVKWNQGNVSQLVRTPMFNFVDSGDFIIGRSVFYELSRLTGCMWNPGVKRFGDWELMTRLAGIGARGHAIDTATHVYHWTGKNVQTTRRASEVDVIPAEMYERLKKEGKIK